MSTLPAEPTVDPSPELPAARVPRRLRVPRPRVPRPRTRQEGGRCGNCGFEDSGHYCSRCGEPLHGTEDSVLEILWSDLVEGPLHNLFALGKTTWLMLVSPHRFFHGVLLRQRGLCGFPFFLAPAWRRVSHKPHGVPNAVKYFVLIYTLALLSAWAFGVHLVPDIPVPILGETLPGFFAEPLFLLFVVVSAWMYALAVSRLLGGRIETGLLTRFMLYLNGFALIPFVGMGIAGVKHPWIFLIFSAFWLYVLFVLPQVALPRLFGVSRWRLAIAQGGAAVGNSLAILVMVFAAGMLAERFGWVDERQELPSLAAVPFVPVMTGFQAWKTLAENGQLPEIPALEPLRRFEQAGGSGSPVPARAQARGNNGGLFPVDTATIAPLVHFRIDQMLSDARAPRLRPDRHR